MKRTFNFATLLVAVVTLLVMASCSEKKKAEVPPASAPAPAPKPVYVWVCSNCGRQIESMERPKNAGECTGDNMETEQGRKNARTLGHIWQQAGQVR